MPFTIAEARSILSSEFKSTCWIGLSSTPPTDTGDNFTEPTTGGYTRQQWGEQVTTKDKQVSNRDIIFFFEATANLGTFTHFGIFTAASGGKPSFYGALTSPITVNTGYVPLIRAGELVIGLDKGTLASGV